MDWSTPGDVHKRFKIFKQKCNLIFDGPLLNKPEGQKARLLLLWAGDKGLEIYNTATWENDADQFKIKPILEKLEAYTKPQSNQILSRYQLRCLKQDDMPLEEFLTKARTLVDDSGYDPAFKDETLRDTLVFGLRSDKVRKDAISKGNSLTFQQVYDLAKTEESTRAQMQVIRQGEQNTELYSVRSKQRTAPFEGSRKANNSKHTYPGNDPKHRSPSSNKPKFKFKFSGCFRCGNKHDSDATCPATHAKCAYCKKTGHFQKVCMKKRLKQVHEIVQSPQYQGQEIHLQGDDGETSDSSSISSCDEDEPSDSEPIAVFLDAITSDSSVDSMSSFPNKIYTTVKVNNQRNIKMKVDTGADTCILTTEDLQRLGLSVEIKPCSSVLKGYGGHCIANLGTTTLQIAFKDASVSSEFTIVEAPGHPSMIGCRQAQELGIITIHVEEVSGDSASPAAQQAAHYVGLSKATVMDEYKDCFDKIGRFPGDQYHIQLIDNPTPVIHPPRTVPVHILPLYKAELEKMIADDIITDVTEPTDWVNSIVCNVKETPDGKKKVRLCLDSKDLNKNIRREHYYSRTIDEILPLLHGKKYFSVVDTTKGYWHVELDYDSSLLCTFNTPFGRYRFKRTKMEVIESEYQSESCAPEYSVHFVTDTSCPIDIGLVKSASAMDPTTQLLKNAIYKGWPEYRKHCPKELWDYWNIRCDLVLEDGLILKGDRVVVPEYLRARVLEVTHTGHQGETKCLLLARQSVFWPGISNDIRQMVKDCEICNRHQQAQPKLPAMQPDLPTRPWEKLGSDIFQFNGANYLIIVDYYSRFPVIRALSNTSASTISSHFTSVFAEYGLPSHLTADFGSQYVSELFKRKCEESGFTLTFSSPYHHQTNGVTERCVGTTKSLWKKAVENNQCPQTALWMYRITPLDDHLPSPYELLYGRKPRSPLPTSNLALQSKHPGNGAHQEANFQKQTIFFLFIFFLLLFQYNTSTHIIYS